MHSSQTDLEARAAESVARPRRPHWLTIAVSVAIFALAVVAAFYPTEGLAPLLLVAICAGIAGVAALRNPVLAIVFLLITLIFRLALPDIPANPFIGAFALLVVVLALWLAANPDARPAVGAVEVAMLLYVGWNVFSMVQEHELPPYDIDLVNDLSLWRYLLVGTIIPFVLYYASRALMNSPKSIRTVLYTLLILGAYSAAVSIMQFTGPSALVWPRYIIDSPNWPGRANGVLNQPGSNGVVLIIGYAVAILLAATITHPRWRRVGFWVITVACACGVYLTHTRAVYLGFLGVVVLGALLARGFRRPFVATLVVLGIGVAANWNTFVSSDRESGGVGSTNEIFDRLNANATGLWAFTEKPWTGWGLGRFLAVNTFHHQQYSPDVPWIRGLSVASHFNELGILAELGLVGLFLWLSVLVLIIVKLVRAIKALPTDGIAGRPLAVTGLMAMAALIGLGLTVDLRLLDYPNAAAFCLAGAAVGALDRARAGLAAEPYVRIPRMRF